MKKEWIFTAAIGGCIGAVLTSLFSLFSPLAAQHDAPDAAFGKITCTELEALDCAGDQAVRIDFLGVTVQRTVDYASGFHIYSKDGNSSLAAMYVEENGGRVVVFGKKGKSQTQLGIDKHGGYVTGYKKDGSLGVFMFTSGDGGHIGALDNEQKLVK